MGWWYPKRRIINVKGGIKAQSRKGGSGQNWWAMRWNQVLQEYDMGARLSRGRTYARKGQVKNITIRKGAVTASVYGSSRYDVEVKITVISDAEWKNIAKAIFARPAIATQLVAGKMPEGVNDVFTSLDMNLFPRIDDMETDCTCPDWANPCKHIAAVYLLLGEEFDRDPFLIFRLRGIKRAKLLMMAGVNGNTEPDRTEPHANTIALEADPSGFWGTVRDKSSARDVGNAIIPSIPAALVKQLGSFPFWRGNDNFLASMEEIYENASKMGTRVFLGEYSKDT